MATTVGFIVTGKRTERAPPCSCRARRAETITNRYMLASGSSGIIFRERCRVSLFIVLAIDLHTGRSTATSNVLAGIKPARIDANNRLGPPLHQEASVDFRLGRG